MRPFVGHWVGFAVLLALAVGGLALAGEGDSAAIFLGLSATAYAVFFMPFLAANAIHTARHLRGRPPDDAPPD